jgi:hypothetical protein
MYENVLRTSYDNSCIGVLYRKRGDNDLGLIFAAMAPPVATSFVRSFSNTRIKKRVRRG